MENDRDMIILRQRQIEFVEKSIEALQKHGNTLGVAPTGAGKTIMLSAVVGELYKQNPNLKVCVIAHRKELTEQNNDKFLKVNQFLSTSVVNAATDKQLQYIPKKYGHLSKGQASIVLSFEFNAKKRLQEVGLVA